MSQSNSRATIQCDHKRLTPKTQPWFSSKREECFQFPDIKLTPNDESMFQNTTAEVVVCETIGCSFDDFKDIMDK